MKKQKILGSPHCPGNLLKKKTILWGCIFLQNYSNVCPRIGCSTTVGCLVGKLQVHGFDYCQVLGYFLFCFSKTCCLQQCCVLEEVRSRGASQLIFLFKWMERLGSLGTSFLVDCLKTLNLGFSKFF